MAYEFEFKYRLKSGHIGRVLSHDGKYLRTLEQRDVYLDDEEGSLARGDRALRIRMERSTTGKEVLYLTYKGPKLDPVTMGKSRKEIEMIIEGKVETAVDIFKALGFHVVGDVVKRREVYELWGVEVCVDEVNGLGSFVELEVKARESEDALNSIFHVRDALKDILGPEETRSYLELLMERPS